MREGALSVLTLGIEEPDDAVLLDTVYDGRGGGAEYCNDDFNVRSFDVGRIGGGKVPAVRAYVSFTAATPPAALCTEPSPAGEARWLAKLAKWRKMNPQAKRTGWVVYDVSTIPPRLVAVSDRRTLAEALKQRR